MDNCYRECKNRYILGFCSLLVERGIFKEVGNLLGEATTEVFIHAYSVNICCCFIHRFHCLFLWLAIHTRMWTRYSKCYLDLFVFCSFTPSWLCYRFKYCHENNDDEPENNVFLKIHSGVCKLSKTQRDYHITLIQHLRTVTRLNHIFVFNFS